VTTGRVLARGGHSTGQHCMEWIPERSELRITTRGGTPVRLSSMVCSVGEPNDETEPNAQCRA